jgi:hypothetical protein
MHSALKTWVTTVALMTPCVISQAQLPAHNTVTARYAIPQGADPPIVIDLTGLNDPQSFSASDLLGAGVEVHGQIPGLSPGTFADILEVQFRIYTGNADFTVTEVNNQPYIPWGESAISDPTDADYTILTLTAQPGSAPINDYFVTTDGPVSFLGLSFTVTGDPTFTTNFDNSLITVTATKEGVTDRADPVPEPGTSMLALGLLCSSGACLLARRRSR